MEVLQLHRADGEEGSDDGDDTRSACGASSRGAAADASD